mgnify:CR=1 FL=1
MSKYEELRDKGFLALRTYMDSLDAKHGEKIAYWLNDYARFLNKETNFDPKDLIHYKRGSIVKVHLGYRVGSEEGGLHYGVVIDTQNDLSSPTATIIPFTSVKPEKRIEKLHRSQVYIGNEIFELLQAKINKEIDESNRTQNLLKKMLDEPIDPDNASPELQRAYISALAEQIKKLDNKIKLMGRMLREIQKMKMGSIALVGQITTISKIRIYDPIYPSDTLSNIRLSAKTMDKLDRKIVELFTKPNTTTQKV